KCFDEKNGNRSWNSRAVGDLVALVQWNSGGSRSSESSRRHPQTRVRESICPGSGGSCSARENGTVASAWPARRGVSFGFPYTQYRARRKAAGKSQKVRSGSLERACHPSG